MKPFTYRIIEKIAELQPAIDPGTRLLAGGSDLLSRISIGLETPANLVDLKRSNLSRDIRIDGGFLHLGALATLAGIEHDARVGEHFPALARAAGLAATAQIRARATIAGNLLQRPRCEYYRARNIDCWLKGGTACPARSGHNETHAIFANDPCCAVHPSDLAPCLMVLNASVHVLGDAGARTLPVASFFRLPEDGHRCETVLAPQEVVTAISIPLPAPHRRTVFSKAMARKSWAFALVSAAAAFDLRDGMVTDVDVVLGGVAPIPWRLHAFMDQPSGAALHPESVDRAIDHALRAASPLSMNRYKLDMTRALVKALLLDRQ